jgi:apolipoprotein N-acyltransferase
VPPRLLAAALAGVALAVSFEPLRLVFLLPVSIATLLWCVRGLSLRRAALVGWVFGLVFMLTLIVWMRAVGTDAWLALSIVQSLFFAVLGVGLAAVSRLPGWPLWSGVVWLAVEVFRGSWPMSGFTWGRVAFATMDTPFAAWLPWVGANGVSLLVVTLSGVLLWAVLEVRERPRPAVAVGLAACLGVLAVPQWWQPHRTTDGEVTVAVVQGDVPGSGDDLLAHHREVTESHVSLTRELGEQVARGEKPRPDFVVWPENTTAVDPFRDGEIRDWIREAAQAVGAPILIGGIVDAPRRDQVLNQGIVFDPVSGAGDRYTKRHPVPFGEYIPYRKHFPERNFGRLALIPRDMISGTRKSPLRIGGVPVADAICFDVAYDDEINEQVRRGARLLVVQTSNAMFIHTGQIEQQFAISRVRALETGRTVVVAAVNGRSGVIGPDGEVDAAIEPRTRDVLLQQVPLTTSQPPAVTVGPWLGRGSVLAALGALLWGVLTYRRRKRLQTAERGETA